MSKRHSQEVFDLVKEFFSGDVQKTFLWFNTENVLLGGSKPINMIITGRSDKLLQFIRSSLADNRL